MTISLIAAMSENRVIGRGGKIPWRLPDDLRFFMRTTMGHPLIMGRRTCESLDAPLEGRRIIVLSRRRAWRPAWGEVEVAPSLDAALELVDGEPEIYVGGGEAVYREALPRAGRIDLTLVHAIVEGDTFFPDFDEPRWRLVKSVDHPADARHAHAFTFQTWESP